MLTAAKLIVVRQEPISTLHDGTLITIRPIRLSDEERMVVFHKGLSDHSIYMRYFHIMALPTRTSHERLEKVCSFDPEHQLVFVAETGDRIVAVGRLMPFDSEPIAEFAILITDGFQGRGLGRRLMMHLIDIARGIGLTEIRADVLSDNVPMLRLCESLCFELSYDTVEHTVATSLRLNT